jgi:hypothetical protein
MAHLLLNHCVAIEQVNLPTAAVGSAHDVKRIFNLQGDDGAITTHHWTVTLACIAEDTTHPLSDTVAKLVSSKLADVDTNNTFAGHGHVTRHHGWSVAVGQ